MKVWTWMRTGTAASVLCHHQDQRSICGFTEVRTLRTEFLFLSLSLWYRSCLFWHKSRACAFHSRPRKQHLDSADLDLLWQILLDPVVSSCYEEWHFDLKSKTLDLDTPLKGTLLFDGWNSWTKFKHSDIFHNLNGFLKDLKTSDIFPVKNIISIIIINYHHYLWFCVLRWKEQFPVCAC